MSNRVNDVVRTLALCCLGQVAAATEVNRPNVLFIAIDDLRPELGCYGNIHVHTPNLDGLASKGVLFLRAYCQAPVCGPSRASVMTGVYPRGESQQSWHAEKLSPGTPTLPEAFRQAGYHTVSNGKLFHHVSDSETQSWSEPPFSLVNGQELNHLTYLEHESGAFVSRRGGRGPFFEAPDVPDDAYIDGMTCEKTIEDMRRLAKADRPFFLACGLIRPHLPFYAPKKYWDLLEADRIEVADNPFPPRNAPAALRGGGEIRSYHGRNIEYNSPEFHTTARHGYYACVSYADALVGKLLATLDELGLRDNTIVVVWGDHGWNLGEHAFWGKHNLAHNATRAPLIISAPGCAQNAKVDGIVGLIDLYPTLCELSGIRPPSHLEGASAAPLLKNSQQAGKQAEFTKHGSGHTITTRDYAYTEWKNRQAEHMLFDRRRDPEENENVAEDPEYQLTVKALSQSLAEHAAKVEEAPSPAPTPTGREGAAGGIRRGAVGGSPSATIVASSATDGHPAALARDGDTKTFWVSDGPPTESAPQWLRVRFDRPTLLRNVEVTGRVSYGPRDTEIRFSDDGGVFRPVARKTVADGQRWLFECEPTTLKAIELRIMSAYDSKNPNPVAVRNVQVAEIQTNQVVVEKYKRANIRYGEHPRHVLDLWQAPSATPTPLVLVIHGGGWNAGDKDRVHRFVNVADLLKEGVSVASINYRLVKHANADGIVPPVKAPMHDAARALQFVRSRAAEWNLDKNRIGAAGGSAGACTSLWLAYHDDLADPLSNDPVERESTRLWCAAVVGPQTTLDPRQMKAWTPNSSYGGHAFGKSNFAEFLSERQSILPWIEEYSPYGLVSADDPPVHLSYSLAPAVGQRQKDPTHSANFGVKLRERCRAFGVACEVVYPGAPDGNHATPTDYLIATLKQDAAKPRKSLPVLYEDDFDNNLSQWCIETAPESSVEIRDGQLDIDASSGCTIWFKHKLNSPVKIEYDATLVQQGGPQDRVSDLNCFWMAIDPKHPDDLLAGERRGGLFSDYDALRLYYVGFGGHGNTKTRFRRYPGTGDRPLLPEHDLTDKKYMNVANKPRRIQIVAARGTTRYVVDGAIVFDIDDKHPLEEGWFAFRTTKSHMRIDNFRVTRPEE